MGAGPSALQLPLLSPLSHRSWGPRVRHEGAPLRPTRKHRQAGGRDGRQLHPLCSSWENTFCSEGREAWLAKLHPAPGKKGVHARRLSGQVGISPDKPCKAGGKGKEKAWPVAPPEAGGGGEEDGASPRGRNSRSSWGRVRGQPEKPSPPASPRRPPGVLTVTE